jgi:membrane fusion protein, multidrug efflux system
VANGSVTKTEFCRAQLGVLRSQAQQADAVMWGASHSRPSPTKSVIIHQGLQSRTEVSPTGPVQAGNYVQPGQTPISAVPTENYIANFEETQLENMRVGQSVRVRVDAFRKQRLDGHIDRFQRGTGSNFALLPPENATANFVKVVQRVLVKIVLSGPADALRSISPGMSVEPTVLIAPSVILMRAIPLPD